MSEANVTNWPSVKLGDFTTVKARLGWKGLKAEEYVEDGYIFLATPNLKGHQIDFHNVAHITKWRYDESPEIQLRIGDVLIVKDGSTLGICSFVRHLPRPTTVNGSIAVVRAKHSLDPEFLFHFVTGDEFQKLISLKKAGLGVPHLFQADLREFPVSLPSLPEQHKIARILTTLDELIEKTEALIAKYQSVKQGMMHDLFTRGVNEHGHLRPTYDEAPELYKESELGWIPKEWGAGSLGTIADLQVGYAFKSAWFKDSGGIRLLRGENVGYGTPDWKEAKWLPHRIADGYQEYLLYPGDVIIGMDRTFTKSGFKISQLREEDCPSLLVQRVGKFVPSRCEADFLRALLSYRQYHFALKQQEKGMDIPHLSQSEILAPTIPIPTAAEQQQVAERILSCDKKLEAERVVLAKLRLQKTGLMQDLLTGKVRVKPDEGDGDV